LSRDEKEGACICLMVAEVQTNETPEGALLASAPLM